MVLYFSEKHKLIIMDYIKNEEKIFIFSNEIKLLIKLILLRWNIMYLIFYITLNFITLL